MEILKIRLNRVSRLLLLLWCITACRAEDFAMHAFHAAKLGRLECNLCHTAASKGSVELKRPGHDQCQLCHAEAFKPESRSDAKANLICSQCHSSSGAGSKEDLVRFPAKRTGTLLVDFPHNRHVDPKGRIDPKTGFRADCTFCHQFTAQGNSILPAHTQCAACHSNPGMKPELTSFLRTAGCRGCHNPEATERPQVQVASVWDKIRFSHSTHFEARPDFRLDCTTCHYTVPTSATLVNAKASLPKMVDCASCHDNSKKIASAHRTSNCSSCHLDALTTSASFVPTNFNRNVKPEFHTDTFRQHHEAMAAAPDAKCFACHQNSVPSSNAKQQCISCHLIMEPVSHTARWRDDIHGKYAAIDRQNCATCHAADYCIRCHNELPASHVPLPLFKNGGHANLAMLNERSCLTCHTYQNTCSECHAGGTIQQAGKPLPAVHK